MGAREHGKTLLFCRYCSVDRLGYGIIKCHVQNQGIERHENICNLECRWAGPCRTKSSYKHRNYSPATPGWFRETTKMKQTQLSEWRRSRAVCQSLYKQQISWEETSKNRHWGRAWYRRCAHCSRSYQEMDSIARGPTTEKQETDIVSYQDFPVELTRFFPQKLQSDIWRVRA